jgi:hypothetical protein
MIQRKQSLFLFLSVILGIALLFIPSATASSNTGAFDVYLIPLNHSDVASTSGHLAAIALNFINLILAFVTIFLYGKRELQLKLCYGLIVLWLVLTLMVTFCPFAVQTEATSVHITFYGTIIGVLGMIASFLAARFIKKDIELIKSADRIR